VRGILREAGLGTALVLAILPATACRQREPEDVIAVIGRHRVRLAGFQGYVDDVLGEPWQSVDGALASRLFDQFLDQEIIATAARQQRGLHIPKDPGRRSAAVRALLGKLCGPPPAPDAAAVDAEVARRMHVTLPERVRVRQMLLDTRAEAVKVAARLRRGEDWITVSREVSRAPNAADGGRLGVIARGTLPPAIDRVVFSLRPGRVSRPVKSPAGYHIFEVLERLPAGPPDAAATRAEVTRELRRAAARRHVRACIDRLAGELGVHVIGSHLWFEYSGRYTEERHGAT